MNKSYPTYSYQRIGYDLVGCVSDNGWTEDGVYLSYLTIGWSPYELMPIGSDMYIVERSPGGSTSLITLAERHAAHERS